VKGRAGFPACQAPWWDNSTLKHRGQGHFLGKHKVLALAAFTAPVSAAAARAPAQRMAQDSDWKLGLDDFSRRIIGVRKMNARCRGTGAIMPRTFAAPVRLIKSFPATIAPCATEDQQPSRG
jgi:hypothetical protein